MRKLFLFVGCLAIIAILAVFLFPNESVRKATDEKNATYVIGDRTVTLVDGVSETPIPESTAKTTVRYFGNEVRKDLNGDGREDVAFLITEDAGGTGTFFYVVAAVNTDDGYVGSEAFLLGDRIAPQTTESGPDASIIVNYADRLPDEPFTAQPSVGKSARLMLDGATLRWEEVE